MSVDIKGARPIEEMQAIAAARRNSPESQARKAAVALRDELSNLRPLVSAVYNRRDSLVAAAVASILGEFPIEFIAFWGVGEKGKPDEHDKEQFGDLERIRDAAAAKNPKGGARVELMLADEHGKFNGFKPGQIYEYLMKIKDQTASRGFGAVWLSDLYHLWGLSLPNPQDPIDITSGFYMSFWANPAYFRQREQFVQSASRHHQSGVTDEQAAYHYSLMRRSEAPCLAAHYPDRILLANTSKELGMPLLPREMPIIFLRGIPAWFLGAS